MHCLTDHSPNAVRNIPTDVLFAREEATPQPAGRAPPPSVWEDPQFQQQCQYDKRLSRMDPSRTSQTSHGAIEIVVVNPWRRRKMQEHSKHSIVTSQ